MYQDIQQGKWNQKNKIDDDSNADDNRVNWEAIDPSIPILGYSTRVTIIFIMFLHVFCKSLPSIFHVVRDFTPRLDGVANH